MAKSPIEIDVDLWSADELANPYRTYAELRELGPVLWMPQHEAFALPRYSEVRQVLQDWEAYSSAFGVGLSAKVNERTGRGILTSDPPLHTGLRGVLNSQLMVSKLASHADFLESVAEGMVGTLVERGAFDAVADLAHAYSLKVVADLVGLPEEGREHLVERSTGAFNTFGPENDLLRSSLHQLEDLFEYCTNYATPERLDPDGWGQQIYASGERGDIEARDCPGLMTAFVWAGMDTTVNAISSAIWLFAEHPEQWDLLRADRSLMSAAINEILRIEPPVHRFTRFSTRHTELDGVAVPAGSRIVVLFGSANRDERRFEDPDRFDITRDPKLHLSFGRGIHRCVGAPLALREMHAVLSALADRVTGFTVGESVRRRNNALHGFERLDVEV